MQLLCCSRPLPGRLGKSCLVNCCNLVQQLLCWPQPAADQHSRTRSCAHPLCPPIAGSAASAWISRKLFCTATVLDISVLSLQDGATNRSTVSRCLQAAKTCRGFNCHPWNLLQKLPLCSGWHAAQETLAVEGGKNVGHMRCAPGG
jgi:hypothetical protein